jgi:amino acid adenylation domain-containing protein
VSASRARSLTEDGLTGAGRLAAWTPADTEQPVPSRFAELARLQPSRTAIAGTTWQPTFAELDAAGEAVASALADRDGAGAGRVALLMDHGAPLVAGMLGALKAGQAIAVLNPSDPAGRLDRIRRQVEPWIVVADSPHRELARLAGFERILEMPDPATGERAPAAIATEAADLAAVMFTSGSTGRPKGVMHTHHSLLHTALRHSTGLRLRVDDRVALLASPSGGHGMGTTWMALLSGATLCPFPVMDRGVAALPSWLREHRVTVMGLSASLFRRLLPLLDGEALPDLRLVRLGSEQVQRADFDDFRRHFGEHCAFANVYSLTEAGGLAHNLIPAGETPPPGPLSAGRAAEGIEIRLVDERGRQVEPGAVGEIVALSSHLSPGYYGDESLTLDRFSVPAPDGRRELRTGDLGLLDPDGSLVIAGRRDAQVKIRGFRVELAEVEAALSSLEEVESAAALAEPTRRGDPRLVAYVVPRADPPPAPAQLRDSLRRTLSDASVPTAFSFVEQLPLNAHGKVDRGQLGALPRPTQAAGASSPPASGLEHTLGEIWAAALELDRVGRDDDFFDLAGDSLAAAEIGAGVFDAFGVEIDLRAFMSHSTVARMARLIRQPRARTRIAAERLERVPRDSPLPCSFAQERIWREARTSGYTSASLTELDPTVDLEALRAALQQVAARHEPLRTTFEERDGGPVQIIHPPAPLQIPLTEIDGGSDSDQRALELLRDDAVEPFDLERGPLVRLRLLRSGDGCHHLLRVTHHLITDRASWRVFFAELAPAYEAIRNGRDPADPAPDRLQYADFAAWERRRLHPDADLYREQLSWWRGALEGRPPSLELPFARPARTSGAPREGASMWWGIDPAATSSLDRLGRDLGVTQYAVRLAVFAALLGLDTGQEELTIGAYVDGRRAPGTHSMFGYFPNLVPVVLPFDPGATLGAWSKKVGYLLVESIARSDLPYRLVCDELLLCGQIPPQIDAIFSVRSPMPPLPFGRAEVPTLQSLFTMPWGFSLTVDQGAESSRCQVDFDADLHDPAEVRTFTDRYAAVAKLAGARPDIPLGDIHRGLSAAS